MSDIALEITLKNLMKENISKLKKNFQVEKNIKNFMLEENFP